MTLRELFDNKGNLPRDFDPYRCGREDDPRYSFLFCEDGYLKPSVSLQLPEMVASEGWGPWCDAVGVCHANRLALQTKGSYPTIYWWR